MNRWKEELPSNLIGLYARISAVSRLPILCAYNPILLLLLSLNRIDLSFRFFRSAAVNRPNRMLAHLYVNLDWCQLRQTKKQNHLLQKKKMILLARLQPHGYKPRSASRRLIRPWRIRSADLAKADSFFRVPLALGDAIICSFKILILIYV